MSIKIKKAKKEDVKIILNFIKALAEYEKEPNSVKMNEETLIKDGFPENEKPLFYCLLIELDGVDIGFALYYYCYSTWYFSFNASGKEKGCIWKIYLSTKNIEEKGMERRSSNTLRISQRKKSVVGFNGRY
jgi:hypothetical protein